MKRHWTPVARAALLNVAVIAALALCGAGRPGGATATARAATIASDEQTIRHVLNRIGFGARPGDVERVRATGVQRYIDEQLHPERIPDAGMTARLSGLTTLGMSSRAIAEAFEIPELEARRERKQDAAPGDVKP